MSLRTYEQAVAFAARQNFHPSQNWANKCQSFARQAVGSSPFGGNDSFYGGTNDARIAFLSQSVGRHTDGPPPPGSLAYFFKSATDSEPGHAVFVVDSGMVYSTPYGSITPTTTGVSLVHWSSFPNYRGYLTHVPDGALDVRALTYAGSAPKRINSAAITGATVDPPAYPPGYTPSALKTSGPWVKNTARIQYNPPLVRSAMHNDGFAQITDSFIKGGEVAGSGGGGVGAVNGKTSPRLGRIIPEDWMPSSGFYPAGLRYGFRFLYNPTSYSESIQYINGVDPSVAAQNLSNAIFSSSTFSFTLYLNRIEDMSFGSYPEAASAYPTTIGRTEFDGIKQFGTFWDLEYLFRTMNGAPKQTWRGVTSEIGLLYSIPTKVYLGRGRRLRGRLDGVNVNHLMFNRDMIPTLTEVQMSFTRYVDTNTDVGNSGNFLDPNTDGAAQDNSTVVNNDPTWQAARNFFANNPAAATGSPTALGASGTVAPGSSFSAH